MRASLLAMATTTTFFEKWASRASSCSGSRPIRFHPQYRSPCSVDEDLAQVDVAAFANAEQPRLALQSNTVGIDTSYFAAGRGLPEGHAPLPMAATTVVATIGPIPGICRMRVQPGSRRDPFQFGRVLQSGLRLSSTRSKEDRSGYAFAVSSQGQRSQECLAVRPAAWLSLRENQASGSVQERTQLVDDSRASRDQAIAERDGWSRGRAGHRS